MQFIECVCWLHTYEDKQCKKLPNTPIIATEVTLTFQPRVSFSTLIELTFFVMQISNITNAFCAKAHSLHDSML
jgi:hypothetical protein